MTEEHKTCSVCSMSYYGQDKLEQFAFSNYVCNHCQSQSPTDSTSLQENALTNNERHGILKRRSKNIQLPSSLPLKKVHLDVKKREDKPEEEQEVSDFKAATHKIIEEEYTNKKWEWTKVQEGAEGGAVAASAVVDKSLQNVPTHTTTQGVELTGEKSPDEGKEEEGKEGTLEQQVKKVEVIKQPIKRKARKKKVQQQVVDDDMTKKDACTHAPPLVSPSVSSTVTTPRMVTTTTTTAVGPSHFRITPSVPQRPVSKEALLVQKGQNVIHSFFDLKEIAPEKCEIMLTVKL